MNFTCKISCEFHVKHFMWISLISSFHLKFKWFFSCKLTRISREQWYNCCCSIVCHLSYIHVRRNDTYIIDKCLITFNSFSILIFYFLNIFEGGSRNKPVDRRLLSPLYLTLASLTKTYQPNEMEVSLFCCSCCNDVCCKIVILYRTWQTYFVKISLPCTIMIWATYTK